MKYENLKTALFFQKFKAKGNLNESAASVVISLADMEVVGKKDNRYGLNYF